MSANNKGIYYKVVCNFVSEFIKEMELPIVGEFLEFLKKIKLGKLN
jgi:hypothetical protein